MIEKDLARRVDDGVAAGTLALHLALRHLSAPERKAALVILVGDLVADLAGYPRKAEMGS